MSEKVIAVGKRGDGLTPLMPFVCRRFDADEFTLPCARLIEFALLRCGFDVVDVCALTPQDAVMLANRRGLDGIITVGYGSFGSGRSFNDYAGMRVLYANSIGGKSKTLAEDVCAALFACGECEVGTNEALHGAACPAIEVSAGQLTNFDEAKLIPDYDYAERIAERVAMGVCEHFAYPYIPECDFKPNANMLSIGKRGSAVKAVQCLLNANGYKLTVDGIYGRNTQAAANMAAGGNDVFDALSHSPKTLPVGSRGARSMYIEKKLLSKLYLAEATDTVTQKTVDSANEFLVDIKCDITLDYADGITEKAYRLISSVGGGRPRLF